MFRQARGVFVAGLVLLLAACGGKAVLDDDVPAGGAGGAGGSSGSSGSGGTGGASGGSGGAGGNVGGSGGSFDAGTDVNPPIDGGFPDGTVTCGRTYDAFSLRAELYDGRSFGCSGGTDFGYAELQGRITEMSMNSFTLDSCPPNADCVAMFSKFSFDAPDMYLWIPVGAFVTVALEVNMPWGCEQRVLVTDLPYWGGEPNPVPTGATVHLAAADGRTDPLPGAPFGIQAIPLGCATDPGGGCGGEPPDDYALQFYSTQTASDPGVTVMMGQAGFWPFQSGSGGTEYWMVRNLRSFSTGYCDDYWNWSWWVTQAMLEE